MNPNPNARGQGAPAAAAPKASIVPYFLAHLVTGLVVFVVLTVFVQTGEPVSFGPVLLDYVTVHLPVPLVLSSVLAWLLTRRVRPPFWAVLLLSVPFYLGALFIYEMGLLMASTQQ
ncbi:hypothetical protein ABTZ99_24355 [Actinosynnema sp. NPDC002837]